MYARARPRQTAADMQQALLPFATASTGHPVAPDRNCSVRASPGSADITMCGALPTAVMLFAARALGAKRALLLKHCHSGEVAPMRQVVGYASVSIER